MAYMVTYMARGKGFPPQLMHTYLLFKFIVVVVICILISGCTPTSGLEEYYDHFRYTHQQRD